MIKLEQITLVSRWVYAEVAITLPRSPPPPIPEKNPLRIPRRSRTYYSQQFETLWTIEFIQYQPPSYLCRNCSQDAHTHALTGFAIEIETESQIQFGKLNRIRYYYFLSRSLWLRVYLFICAEPKHLIVPLTRSLVRLLAANKHKTSNSSTNI